MEAMHTSYLLPAYLIILSLTCSHLPKATADYYFTTHGAFNNSCKVAECTTCGQGAYRLGCANANMGGCTSCTRIPNATFTSHGWFNNSCSFTCNEGFSAVGRSCSPVVYSIQFPASITLISSANQVFNATNYLNAVANLAGCGVCGNTKLNPTQCGLCSLLYSITSSVPIVYRRLLSSASVVNVDTTIFMGNKIQANAAVTNINTDNLNSKLVLSNPNSGTAIVIAAPTLTTQIITAPPPPTVPPRVDPTPPPVSQPPTATPSPKTSSNIGAIAGGAVGGIFGLVLISVLVWYFTRQAPTAPPKPRLPATGSRFIYRRRDNQSNPKLTSKFVYVPKH